MSAVLRSIPKSPVIMTSEVHAEVRAMAPFLEHLLMEHGISGENADIAMSALLNLDRYHPNDILNLRGGLRPAQAYIIDRAVRLARANEWWCEDFNEALCDLLGVSRHEDGSAIKATDWYAFDGYNCKGVNRSGYGKDGYDSSGWDRDGYDRSGNSKTLGGSRDMWARDRVVEVLRGVKAEQTIKALIHQLEIQMEIRHKKEEKQS